jgi:serralysin
MTPGIGNQMFTYIGSGNFTGAAGQLRFANGLVQGDLNGDRWSDFWFEVNTPTLAASDFIL